MQKYEILLNPSNKNLHFSIVAAAVSPASPARQLPPASPRGFSRQPSPGQSSRSASKPPCQQRPLLVPLLVPLSVPFSRFFPRAPPCSPRPRLAIPHASSGRSRSCCWSAPFSQVLPRAPPGSLRPPALTLGQQATVPAASAAGPALGPVLAVFPASKLLYKKRNPRLSSRINFNLINL